VGTSRYGGPCLELRLLQGSFLPSVSRSSIWWGPHAFGTPVWHHDTSYGPRIQIVLSSIVNVLDNALHLDSSHAKREPVSGSSSGGGMPDTVLLRHP